MRVEKALRALWEKECAEPDTWGETDLHASDLTKCPRYVWARRNGRTLKYFDPKGEFKKRFGKYFEKIIADAYRADGHDFVEQREIESHLFGVPIRTHMDFDFPGENESDEIKTTVFWSGYVGSKKDGSQRREIRPPKDEKLMAYRIQAATSAMLAKRRTYNIAVVCTASGSLLEEEHRTSDMSELIESLVEERSKTAPGDPEPEAAPTYEQECTYCPYAACALNNNPFLQVIQ